MKHVTKSPCPQCGTPNQTTTTHTNGTAFNLYVLTDCKKCRQWRSLLTSVGVSASEIPSTTKVDGLSASVRSQRLGNEKDLLQPFKKDGTVNDAFVTVYGRGGMYQEYGLSERQVETMQERHESVHEING